MKRGILYGLPVILEGDGCTPANWFAGLLLDFLCDTLGFNGMVLEYEPGGYWPTLWFWLTGDISGGE